MTTERELVELRRFGRAVQCPECTAKPGVDCHMVGRYRSQCGCQWNDGKPLSWCQGAHRLAWAAGEHPDAAGRGRVLHTVRVVEAKHTGGRA